MNIESIRECFSAIQALAIRYNRRLPIIIESLIDPIDLSSWLSDQFESTKVYWADRTGEFEIAGVGEGFVLKGNAQKSAAEQADQLLDILESYHPILLSAQIFDPARSNNQGEHSNHEDICFIPKKMIVRDGNVYSYRICLQVEFDAVEQDIIGRAQEIMELPPEKTGSTGYFELGPAISSHSYPNFEQWQENVVQVLEAIGEGRVEKVVLARRTDYIFEQKIEPAALLSFQKKHNRNCFAMMYQWQAGKAFISVSPERLYRRKANKLELDAISSTVLRGESDLQDCQYEKELLVNDKERLEHRYVIEGVTRAASELCVDAPIIGETTVLKLDRVQHLWTPLEGMLRDGIGDFQILDRFHPTPAVGGTPRKEAMELIREMDNFDRGYYASPFGYISPTAAEFAVGIRALVVEDDKVSVFTGAGIVTGSDPRAEWNELNSKDILRPFIAESMVR